MLYSFFRRPTTIDMRNVSTLEDIQVYDDIISFSTPSLFQPSNEPAELFSWLSFFIGVAVVLFLLFIISIIIFLIVRYRKEHNFKPVPVYV